jgi:hypothetical protein
VIEMDGITKIDFVIDLLEVLQSELETLSYDEVYDTLEDVIIILALMEADT